ncbi:nucleotidyltransferase domain-containing protein [Candidatus Uhrbacteria bacterium]|nr:nucleotidyltransferase domain-containing protein [Candidatus Uhrbacteria bacterium]
MRLEHYSIEKLKKEILEIIGKHVDLKTHRVFFFGSRVSGIGTERSDIDVGIEGSESIDWSIMGAIKDAIEHIPTLYTIDIVDMAATKEQFQSVAKQHIEMIHPV